MATARSGRRAFWLGVRAGMPFNLVIVPFGMLFGVVAGEAGLDLAETMAMTVLVIAGAAQFAATQLLADGAPALVAVATGLAVNLRMAMYSASFAPHLGALPLGRRMLAAYFMVDQTYGVAIREFEAAPDAPAGIKFLYFMGSAMAICPVWCAASLAGAVLGTAIPPALALDFALPIAFIALVAPALRSAPHAAAALVSATAALILYGVPLNGGLMLAALAGMATGAAVEIWLERRQ